MLRIEPALPIAQDRAHTPNTGDTDETAEGLNAFADEDLKRSRDWPKGPQALSRRMRRIAPALRSMEIEYSEDEQGHGRRKVKTLRWLREDGDEYDWGEEEEEREEKQEERGEEVAQEPLGAPVVEAEEDVEKGDFDFGPLP